MSLPIFSLDYFDDGRKQFAEALADVVSDIDLRNEPVTVGIKGDWGSGKSLALRAVMERLKANGLEVVEFFPWQSSNPANLIEDFFKTLSEALHPRNRRLSRKLLTYSNRLIELDLHKRLNALGRVGRLLSGTYYSIATARETIERELAKLPKGVAVLIDDIDRLDGDELFETLRLIRNTAHFNNIAYVVAYDEEYVVKMLQSKGVANAERYLDKIFRLNMPLPAFEAYTYVGVIMRQLERMYPKGSPDFTLLSRLVTRSC